MRACRELRALGTDEGTLELIVVRPSEGERETPDTAELTIEDGLVGDRWRPYVDAEGTARRGNQLTIASTRLLDLIAEEERWPLSGDNLLVDMGLDKAGLPAGSEARHRRHRRRPDLRGAPHGLREVLRALWQRRAEVHQLARRP